MSHSFNGDTANDCIIIDDETDMKALEDAVRGIEKDGLLWGSSKLVPVGYGVRKLQITLVIEDAKISLDELRTSAGHSTLGVRY